MPKTLSKMLEQRLLRSSAFSNHLRDLYQLTGLEVMFYNALGEERLRFPRKARTPLRLIGQNHPEIANRQRDERQAQLVDPDRTSPLPWSEVVHPVRVDEEPVGYLVMSAWRPEDETSEELRSFWTSLVRASVDLTWKELVSAWNKLPAATHEDLASCKRLMRLVADDAIRQLEHPNSPHLIPDQLPPMIRKACDHVQTHFREPVTLEGMAAICQVSPEHLSRTFHQTTGLRFREYVAETRIQSVCSDLETTSDPIGEVAERNGFPTLSRFNRSFKESTGLTPREWRKRRFRRT